MRTVARAAVVAAVFLPACSGDAGGFDAPESAVHDPVDDVYLVSNANGPPAAKDGNGYIARVRPDGSMTRYWIRSGTAGVTLDAPKGLAIAGDVLWVADIDVLRRFDRRSGKPLGDVPIPGATFLNDVSALPDGTIFCTDSGLDAQLQPTGTDAIWRVASNGSVSPFVKTTDLGQPSGLVARDAGVYVVSWRDGTFFQVDYSGNRTDLGKAPSAQLDGLVRVDAAAGDTGAAGWFTTSWAGRCIHRFDTSGACTTLPRELEQPAALGFDAVRRRLLVPLPGRNRLELLPL